MDKAVKIIHSEFLNQDILIDDSIRSEEWKTALSSIIEYLKSTSDDDWCTEVARSSDGMKNCLLGHVWNYGNGNNDQKSGNSMIDKFEYISTPFYYFPINDGKNPLYQQPNAKLRCIALLENILNGHEMTTIESMDYCCMMRK